MSTPASTLPDVHTTRIRAESLGAGIQSTTVALLSVDGILPPIEHAIFADTGWEPLEVYEHLDRLEPVLVAAGIQVHRVSVGNIRSDALDPTHRFASMPLFVQGEVWSCAACEGRGTVVNPLWVAGVDDPDDDVIDCAECKGAGGSDGKGMVRRQCTNEYKLKPIKAKVRELLGAEVRWDDNGVRRVGRVKGRPGDRVVENWVGISADEVIRIKPSDVRYMHRVDPLVDILKPEWTRARCEAWLADRWPWPVPRSACVGCPFHTNAEWRRMRDTDPTSWEDAVEFDTAIRNGNAGVNMPHLRGKAYLHADRIPLRDANIDKVGRRERADAQGNLLDVIDLPGCDPYGCRRTA